MNGGSGSVKGAEEKNKKQYLQRENILKILEIQEACSVCSGGKASVQDICEKHHSKRDKNQKYYKVDQDR